MSTCKAKMHQIWFLASFCSFVRFVFDGSTGIVGGYVRRVNNERSACAL